MHVLSRLPCKCGEQADLWSSPPHAIQHVCICLYYRSMTKYHARLGFRTRGKRWGGDRQSVAQSHPRLKSLNGLNMEGAAKTEDDGPRRRGALGHHILLLHDVEVGGRGRPKTLSPNLELPSLAVTIFASSTGWTFTSWTYLLLTLDSCCLLLTFFSTVHKFVKKIFYAMFHL